MDGKGVSLAPLLERLGQNPAALGLLGQLLGGGSDTGGTVSGAGSAAAWQNAAAESDADADTATAGSHTDNGDTDGATDTAGGGSVEVGARVLPDPPPGRDHGRGRREVLLALRPFLSERRCASVDRLLRALELYEVIEESRK